MKEICLRYGMNPNQSKAKVQNAENTPIKILNGEASYINFLDALNAFQLVRELRQATGQPAAASFKHVSPAGAAVYSPLNKTLSESYFIEGVDLSPLAIAYARARGTDRMSSFGDCAAFSDEVDITVASLLKTEVSDMIVAPRYTQEALENLKQKKKGKYLILEIDPNYVPDPIEKRTVFGITLEQQRNDVQIGKKVFNHIVTTQCDIPDNAKKDLLVALITLKYTQSNSICFALDGQTIGIGAGQQSRIHCTRLAAEKADNWWLRQHLRALNMKFREGISRVEVNNAIDGWLNDDITEVENEQWKQCFEEVPTRLSKSEKREWLKSLKGVSYASDAFLPFRDNIDRAAQSGVKYVVQTGNSLRDEQVTQAAKGICSTFPSVISAL
ncbi:5-aminoimidazole-4-carboxamide ribonucleotide transformylase [Priestia megaterium]|uniref:phosphoribosylaminoimidazolecarboxamide formyltransferase n=1 Tax=Priestia megaterium TaxID=1404 RepID=UPI000BED2409|nr:phosphoribosylaminoimidazolecarboxamide formyltransferase [Priestia megaterium]MDH2361752.1 phosphoribosylaminoimidazolecarboxamide formyltransferase [Priestia megaterium]MDP9574682.1 phosphoribosylaminoimidazolecarboxamide formyltransferase/IMP cyclohydrolase [Bacillus sp. 1751]PEA37221.1 5-aminoimidazole-4-carboxamide ribonucleotide transformylase [Priestia megaterium]PGT52373.1 5-aminoimidazole-4-carboxamide ribonucleotide transformylase [Priestia megaterium]